MHFVYHRNMQDMADIPWYCDPSWRYETSNHHIHKKSRMILLVSVKNWRKAGNRIIIHIIF